MGSNMTSKAAGVYVVANSNLVHHADVPYPEDKKYPPSRQKGKKVIAPALVSREVGSAVTRTSLEKLEAFITDYKNLLALHGSCSLNIHAANGMSSLFQAFGQNIAYLGECSQAIVDCQFCSPDALAVSTTLPALIIGTVGTVGGGTGLPAFRTTLAMVDCYGTGKAKKLAEIMLRSSWPARSGAGRRSVHTSSSMPTKQWERIARDPAHFPPSRLR